MKIISNFKDYYDGINASFHDDVEPIYKRQSKIIQFGSRRIKEEEPFYQALQPIFKLWDYCPRPSRNCSINEHIVFFCGKAYLGAEYKNTTYYESEKLIQSYWEELKTSFTVSQQVKEAFASLMKEKDDSAIWERHRKLNIETWRKFNERDLSIPDSVFRFFKSPAFVVYLPNQHHVQQRRTSDNLFSLEPRWAFSAHENKKVGYNRGFLRIDTHPCLTDFDFQKVFSPYLAYQELSMYVGNNLAEQMDPTTTLTDKERAETHGFNKWSFRRHKTEDSKYRKKNEGSRKLTVKTTEYLYFVGKSFTKIWFPNGTNTVVSNCSLGTYDRECDRHIVLPSHVEQFVTAA